MTYHHLLHSMDSIPLLLYLLLYEGQSPIGFDICLNLKDAIRSSNFVSPRLGLAKIFSFIPRIQDGHKLCLQGQLFGYRTNRWQFWLILSRDRLRICFDCLQHLLQKFAHRWESLRGHHQWLCHLMEEKQEVTLQVQLVGILQALLVDFLMRLMNKEKLMP